MLGGAVSRVKASGGLPRVIPELYNSGRAKGAAAMLGGAVSCVKASGGLPRISPELYNSGMIRPELDFARRARTYLNAGSKTSKASRRTGPPSVTSSRVCAAFGRFWMRGTRKRWPASPLKSTVPTPVR